MASQEKFREKSVQDKIMSPTLVMVGRRKLLSNFTRRHLFSDVTAAVGRCVQRSGDIFHSPHAKITHFVKSMAMAVQHHTDTNEMFLVQLLSKQVGAPFRTVVDLCLHCDFDWFSNMTEPFSSLPLLKVDVLSPKIRDAPVRFENHLPSTLQKVRLIEILDWISKINPDHAISDIFLIYDPNERVINISTNGGLCRLELRSMSSEHIKTTLNSVFGQSSEDILDELLCEPRYGNLKRLTIEPADCMRQVCAVYLVDKLPHCGSRGIFTGTKLPKVPKLSP
ncbi:hypothetical protein K443DRAFT_656370 [Laccaria amethystina LaAM-08-1]|uniref:Uncharacterized protein n=1 Tax=Laccaria amethystina LaAM-08-1 TaxID=1095629 RepID=A0A0C9X0R2_9AGAR|nr:hypothetical protein K443DRAFT_656370 [Laccaria amethystina LaAM-08-1]